MPYVLRLLCTAVLHHFCFWCGDRQLSERLYLPSAQRGISLAEQLPLHDLRYTHSQAGSDPDLQLVPSAGKCHSCGAKIPFRYTLVESLNAILYVLIFAYFGIFEQPVYAALVCLFCSALIVVFFMDLDTQLISLYVIGFIGLLGVAVTVYDVCTGNGTLLSHLIGAAAASVPLFLLVILSGERAMGRGDAELMLAGGLFLGVKGVVVGLFLGLILGCIFGMIHKAKTGDSKFAFGPYLSAGMAMALVVGEPIANLYLQLCGLK